MSSQKLTPVEKALIGNYLCLRDDGNGKCGAKNISFQILPSTHGKSILLTCTKNHTSQVPLVEE